MFTLNPFQEKAVYQYSVLCLDKCKCLLIKIKYEPGIIYLDEDKR